MASNKLLDLEAVSRSPNLVRKMPVHHQSKLFGETQGRLMKIPIPDAARKPRSNQSINMSSI
jgi:hypothetical protein